MIQAPTAAEMVEFYRREMPEMIETIDGLHVALESPPIDEIGSRFALQGHATDADDVYKLLYKMYVRVGLTYRRHIAPPCEDAHRSPYRCNPADEGKGPKAYVDEDGFTWRLCASHVNARDMERRVRERGVSNLAELLEADLLGGEYDAKPELKAIAQAMRRDLHAKTDD